MCQNLGQIEAWGGTHVLQFLDPPGRKLDDGKQCWHTIWR